VSEEVSEVEGEWLSIADMEKLNFSEFLGRNSCDIFDSF
jgi:hypothetical protein